MKPRKSGVGPGLEHTGGVDGLLPQIACASTAVADGAVDDGVGCGRRHGCVLLGS